MKLSFRPMPGLTITVIIALAILISLGTWQYQRLQWKTNLLAEIDAVADAPPFTSLAQVQAALDAGEPIDFRRYGAENHTTSLAPTFFVYTSENRDVSWKLFSPIWQDDVSVFAALRVVSNADRETALAKEAVQFDYALTDYQFTGYVRLARHDKFPATDSTPEKNRWFGFNPMPDTHSWADGVPGGADMRFYIDTVQGAQSANALPARRPDIRNNHFDYMLTWYGLAITLLVFYVLMHKRAGRLSWS